MGGRTSMKSGLDAQAEPYPSTSSGGWPANRPEHWRSCTRPNTAERKIIVPAATERRDGLRKPLKHRGFRLRANDEQKRSGGFSHRLVAGVARCDAI